MLAAEAGDLGELVQVGAQDHGLEPDLDAALDQQVEAAAEGGVRAGLAGDGLVGLAGGAVDADLDVARGILAGTARRAAR